MHVNTLYAFMNGSQLVYIGRTKFSVRERELAHVRKARRGLKIKPEFAELLLSGKYGFRTIAEYANPLHAKVAEQLLISWLVPPYNSQHVKGTRAESRPYDLPKWKLSSRLRDEGIWNSELQYAIDKEILALLPRTL
jgi:hypothetical protein